MELLRALAEHYSSEYGRSLSTDAVWMFYLVLILGVPLAVYIYLPVAATAELLEAWQIRRRRAKLPESGMLESPSEHEGRVSTREIGGLDRPRP